MFSFIVMDYFVYILECADKTLYTGCTSSIYRRIAEHNSGNRGAKYTRNRRPVKLLYSEQYKTIGEARHREAEIKKMRRQEKIILCNKKSPT